MFAQTNVRKQLHHKYFCDNMKLRKFEQMFEKRDREVHMMDYKAEIIKLINKLNASDETFLKQVYIIIKKHFDRREGR